MKDAAANATYLEHEDGKWWSITVSGKTTEVRYGALGDAGAVTVKVHTAHPQHCRLPQSPHHVSNALAFNQDHATDGAAGKFEVKMIKEKKGKGYEAATAGVAKPAAAKAGAKGKAKAAAKASLKRKSDDADADEVDEEADRAKPAPAAKAKAKGKAAKATKAAATDSEQTAAAVKKQKTGDGDVVSAGTSTHQDTFVAESVNTQQQQHTTHGPTDR